MHKIIAKDTSNIIDVFQQPLGGYTESAGEMLNLLLGATSQAAPSEMIMPPTLRTPGDLFKVYGSPGELAFVHANNHSV